MKKIIYATTLLFILLSGMFANGQGFSPQVEARLQKIIDSFQNNPANPYIGGMSVAVKVDDLAGWQGATGYAARNVDEANNLLPGGTPFTIHTLSRIYSITKSFTAPLVLALAKEHVFRLDDPVSLYIPLNLINPGLNGNVTIRQLLAHESGYSDYVNEQNLQIAVAAQPTHIWTPFEMLTFVHQIAQPGAERVYCSTNYVVLGAIIEIATGKHVEDLYRKAFFKPLDLHSMYLSIREQKGGRGVLASPHDNISPFNPIFQATGQPTFPDTMTNISRFPLTAVASLAFTGGGIISNVADVAEWSSYLFSGQATGKDIINTMIKSISPTPDKDGDRLGYGIFLSTKISPTDIFIGHDGSAPGYRSIMFYQPDKKLTLAILTNYYGANLFTVAKVLYKAMPDFSCDGRGNNNISICLWGRSLCLPRPLAGYFIRNYGAILGDCTAEMSIPVTKSNIQMNSKIQTPFTAQDNNLGAYPNPFNNTLSFTFKTKESGSATLKLYDMNGKLVANVFEGFVQKGITQKVDLNAGKLPAGIYISRLQTASGFTEQKVMRSR